jgi:hypothetical protein
MPRKNRTDDERPNDDAARFVERLVIAIAEVLVEATDAGFNRRALKEVVRRRLARLYVDPMPA